MPKRKKKQRKPTIKKVKRKTKYYPVILCLKEDKVICFSLSDIPLKYDKAGNASLKRKVGTKDWSAKDSHWLSEEHKIDMSKYEANAMVFCEKCKQPVDFRVFPSSEQPQMINKNMERDSKPMKVKK